MDYHFRIYYLTKDTITIRRIKDKFNTSVSVNGESMIKTDEKGAALLMETETPAIINVASSAALMALGGTSMYSASKAAVKGLTEAMREELRGEAYIGLVCPGFTKTDIFRNQKKSSSKSQKAMDMVSTSCDRMVKLIINSIWNLCYQLLVFSATDKEYPVTALRYSII